MDKKEGMRSIKEIYRIGRRPSSSHTMGPEKACKLMLEAFPRANRFEVILYGSLAKTGKGHRTDYAIKQIFGEIPVHIVFDVGWLSYIQITGSEKNDKDWNDRFAEYARVGICPGV